MAPRLPPRREGRQQLRAASRFLFYGYYYAVQAMFLAGGDEMGRVLAAGPRVADQKATARRRMAGEVSEDFSTAMRPDHPPAAEPVPARVRGEGAGVMKRGASDNRRLRPIFTKST